MDSAVCKKDDISAGGCRNIRKSVNISHHRLKEKNSYLSKCRKCFDKIQYSFLMKTVSKIGNRRGELSYILKKEYLQKACSKYGW